MNRFVATLLLLPSLLSAQQVANPWPLGSRVHTNNLVYARADSTAAGTVLATRAIGDRGTIIGGPIGPVADGSIRWKVQYDTPPTGWSTQLYLTLDSAAVLPPPPPPAPVVFGFRASWLTLFGCAPVPNTACTRGPFPIFDDSTGAIKAHATAVVTFTP